MEVERKRTWRGEPWTQDNRLVSCCDLGESAVWLELGPGPAPHCYLIIFCSSRRSYDRGEGGG